MEMSKEEKLEQKNKKKKINEIAKQLEQIIAIAESTAARKNGKIWLEKYEELVAEIRYELEIAKSCVENMKEHGLTINTIEAEGCLRGLMLINSRIEMIEQRSD